MKFESLTVEQKQEFLKIYLSHNLKLKDKEKELKEKYQISRGTADRWLKKFNKEEKKDYKQQKEEIYSKKVEEIKSIY